MITGKRIGSFLLALVLVLSMAPVQARAAEATSGYCGDSSVNGGMDVSWSLQDGVLTISGTGKTGEYGSMGEMYGVPFGHDHISTPWTETAVTSFVVEEGVTAILGLLSWGAYNLTEVSLPDSLKTIGHCSFEDCDSLTSITIPKNVTSIWSGAFWACENLTSITFTGDAPSINDYAFNSAVTATCYYPASANWPADKLKDYGGNLTWVAYDTCADGHNFGTDNVCTGCNIIGGTCGSNLTWTLDDAGKLTITGTGDLKDYNYGSSPFYKYADKITSVSLPDGLTSIGKRAFDATFPNLEYIEIPTSVTLIRECAFGASYDQVKLKYAGTMEQWNTISIVAFASYGKQYGAECSDGTIIYKGPCGGSNGLYSTVQYALLGDGTLKITGSGDMRFYSSLNYDSCFSSDSKIKKVVIDEGVTSIAGYAFKNCENLKEVHIPASVKTIDYNVFDGCTSLSDVYYGSNEKNWNKMSISTDSNEPLAAATIHYTDLCAGGHSWTPANCTTPKTCPVCDATEGEALGHNWSDATCTDPKTCGRCGATEGVADPAAHGWTDATCVSPKTCTLCGATEGEANPDGHVFENYVCKHCGIIGGQCGVEAFWTLKDGLLTVYGSGAMDDYTEWNQHAPWESRASQIKAVQIREGITYIGDSAFEKCENLTDVTIAGTVTMLGSSCFSGCSSLTGIDLPDGITAIPFEAFSHTGLSSIRIPDSVTTIGGYAFAYCRSLPGIQIPETVTSIGSNAFAGCELLKVIRFTGSAPTIGNQSFLNVVTTALYPADNATWTADVRKPYGGTVTWVAYGQTHAGHSFDSNGVCSCGCIGGTCGQNARWALDPTTGTLTISGTGKMEDFYSSSQTPWAKYKDAVHKVVVEEGITHVGGCAFKEFSNLETVSLPDSLTSIGSEAIMLCTKLKEIEIPENVTQIGSYAFERCYALESVVLPEGLTTISSGLFNSCTSLKSVTIPASVTTIGISAFSGCSSLADVYYGSNEKAWQKIDIGSNTVLNNATIHYTDPCLQGHDWADADCDAPKTCSVCGATDGDPLGHDWADADCDAPKTCSVCGATDGDPLGHDWIDADCNTPKTCKVCGATEGSIAVDNHSFTNGICLRCSFPEGLTYSVIDGCVTVTGYSGTLEVLPIPETIEKLPVNAISNYAFSSCSVLKQVVIPKTIVSIGNGAFNNCSGLTAILVDEANTAYCSDSHGALLNKEKTTLIRVPAAFAGHYVISEGVTRIDGAFEGCSKMTALSVPSSLKFVSIDTFNGCSTLTDIHITDLVSYLRIGTGGETTCCPFGSANTLGKKLYINGELVTDLVIPEGVGGIGGMGGTGLSSIALRSITFPDSMRWISWPYLEGCENLEYVVLPAGLDSISSNAFENFGKLHHILFKGTAAQWRTVGEPNTYGIELHVEATGKELKAFIYNGEEYLYCTVCNNHIDSQGNMTEHIWRDTVCGDTKTCELCGTTDGDPLGHDWADADCDTPKTCKACGATVGNPLGHDWADADCENPKTCTVCGTTQGNALGHNWESATCTENATCKRCGEVSYGTKLNHKEAYISAVAATCTTVGKTEGKYCSVCGTVTLAQQTVPAKGHTEVIDKAVAATCTTIGKTEGSHCNVCGTVLAAQQTIPAKGHAAVPDAAVAATCTTAGKTSGSHCQNCGEVIMSQVVIPAAGHSWKDGTCTAPKTCKNCGLTDGGVVHTYDSQYDYKCNVCGKERTVDMTRPMVDMYRMYDPNSGEHFYTGSDEEKDNLIAAGWNYEGVGFTFPLTTGKPVHRLYDPVYGEHLYTMDEDEMNKLLAEGWNYEGIAFNSGFENEVPQYRLHNPNATRGAYHFTASIEERDMLMALGWEYQGIGWYSLGA